LTQSSSSHGRLEQLVVEREATLQDCEKKLSALTQQCNQSQMEVESLRSHVAKLETALDEKERKLVEMDAILAEQYRLKVFFLLQLNLRGVGFIIYRLQLPYFQPL
jgi:peptidoglycan hydrolase CwlO-like protein